MINLHLIGASRHRCVQARRVGGRPYNRFPGGALAAHNSVRDQYLSPLDR
jgi:hypothetical protein